MKAHKGCIRAYNRASKAYYADKNTTTIIVDFGMYEKGGEGTTGEMIMIWKVLSKDLVPQLQCFDDSWHALSTFVDVLQEMAKVDGKNITEEAFCKILDRCGFKDITKYENPHQKKPFRQRRQLIDPSGLIQNLTSVIEKAKRKKVNVSQEENYLNSL